jgi:hypothetical protein
LKIYIRVKNLTVRLEIVFATNKEVAIKITEPKVIPRLQGKMDSRVGIAEEGGPYHPLGDGDTIAFDSDDVRLKQLGYKQELSRRLSYACFLIYLFIFFWFLFVFIYLIQNPH